VPFTIPGWNRSSKEADPRRGWLRNSVDPSNGSSSEGPVERMSWEEICRRPECRGRWVALQGCRYDEQTGKAAEGQVVDVDDDLAALCGRVRDQWKNCAILYVTPVPN
jgi:hypothetical protein